MVRPHIRHAVAAFVLLAFAGCVDDPIQPDQYIPLTEDEARLLGLQAFRDAMVAALAASPDSAPAAKMTPLRAPVSFSSQDSATVACAFGGVVKERVTLSGQTDEELGTADFRITVVQTHVDCQTEENGVRMHVDGDPNLALSFDFVLKKDGTITLDGALSGGIRAAVGYRSSTCAVNATFQGIARPDGSSDSQMTGTVCGTPVSQTVSQPG